MFAGFQAPPVASSALTSATLASTPPLFWPQSQSTVATPPAPRSTADLYALLLGGPPSSGGGAAAAVWEELRRACGAVFQQLRAAADWTVNSRYCGTTPCPELPYGALRQLVAALSARLAERGLLADPAVAAWEGSIRAGMASLRSEPAVDEPQMEVDTPLRTLGTGATATTSAFLFQPQPQPPPTPYAHHSTPASKWSWM